MQVKLNNYFLPSMMWAYNLRRKQDCSRLRSVLLDKNCKKMSAYTNQLIALNLLKINNCLIDNEVTYRHIIWEYSGIQLAVLQLL